MPMLWMRWSGVGPAIEILVEIVAGKVQVLVVHRVERVEQLGVVEHRVLKNKIEFVE